MAEKESLEAILNTTTHPEVQPIFVELLVKVKKKNKNFTNISCVDEDKPLLSLTAQNKDKAANDIDGVETASLDAQVAQLIAKQ